MGMTFRLKQTVEYVGSGVQETRATVVRGDVGVVIARGAEQADNLVAFVGGTARVADRDLKAWVVVPARPRYVR